METERELQVSSLSRILKTGLKNIAADVEVDQSKISQIGDASVVFGELFFGSWLLAAMCTLMEPCLWSGCIWCVRGKRGAQRRRARTVTPEEESGVQWARFAGRTVACYDTLTFIKRIIMANCFKKDIYQNYFKVSNKTRISNFYRLFFHLSTGHFSHM